MRLTVNKVHLIAYFLAKSHLSECLDQNFEGSSTRKEMHFFRPDENRSKDPPRYNLRLLHELSIDFCRSEKKSREKILRNIFRLFISFAVKQSYGTIENICFTPLCYSQCMTVLRAAVELGR